MTTRVTLHVEGLICIGCENNIEFALVSLDGNRAVDDGNVLDLQVA